MEWKKSGVFTRFLIVSLFLILPFYSSACVVMESPDTYRMMFFQARTGNSSPLQIFNYSPALYASYNSDPEGIDRVRNAKEWQVVTGNGVVLEDILAIQYETSPDSLQFAYSHNKLQAVFEENSFIQFLLRPSSKLLLEYLLFSKQAEATETAWSEGFESWNSDANEMAVVKQKKLALLVIAKKRLSTVKDDFLKKRYAYQLCRLSYQLQRPVDVIATYDRYFKKFNGNELMNVWSALFYAQSLNATKKKAKANYYYSLVFDNCDSKKLRAHQLFNSDEATFTAGLKLAKTAHEKAVMWVMRVINNPGPVLNSLKTIYALDPKSSYMTFLLAREINKLEDWICTPAFTAYSPAVSPQWNFSQAMAKNMKTDLEYLGSFMDFVKQQQQQARGELHQYLTLALAHLCLINDNTKEGLDYLNAIGLSENSSIEIQKNIETAWVMAKTTDITDNVFKDQFVIYCHKLHRLAKSDNTINKTLYSLLLGVAGEYEKRFDFATAGLLTMKADQYKRRYDAAYAEDFSITSDDNYQKIRYFDKCAGIGDMDNLIRLLSKTDKSDFEDYITEQPLGSVNLYRDLQGTLAFRQNDFKTAYSIFRKIDPSFWRISYAYKDCLNEDPFVSKVLCKNRNFSYHFDKAKFVKRLLDLQDKTHKKTGVAENAILLGNAYFNCSYFGNSWMMVEYGWSRAEPEYHSPTDSLGYFSQFLAFKLPPVRVVSNPLKDDNYYNCKLAAHYFHLAADDPKASNEQRAYALLMLHECNYLPWVVTNYSWYDDNKPKYPVGKELREFYAHYADTKIYHDYRCPLLDAFIANK